MIKSVIPEFKAGTEAALRAVVTMNGKYSVSEGSKKFGLACGKSPPYVLYPCMSVASFSFLQQCHRRYRQPYMACSVRTTVM